MLGKSRFLRGMTAHNDLSGDVRLNLFEAPPVQFVGILLRQRQSGIQIAMNEQMMFCFKSRQQVVIQKPQMFDRDLFRIQAPAVLRVGLQGFPAAEPDPGGQGDVPLQCVEQHHFMIAAERNALLFLSPFDDPFHHLPGVGTPIQVIPQCDESILKCQRDNLKKRLKCRVTTMNIADGENSRQRPSLVRKSELLRTSDRQESLLAASPIAFDEQR